LAGIADRSIDDGVAAHTAGIWFHVLGLSEVCNVSAGSP